jgi:hypothetical protein
MQRPYNCCYRRRFPPNIPNNPLASSDIRVRPICCAIGFLLIFSRTDGCCSSYLLTETFPVFSLLSSFSAHDQSATLADIAQDYFLFELFGSVHVLMVLILRKFNKDIHWFKEKSLWLRISA